MAELLLGSPVAAALTQRYAPIAEELAKEGHRPTLCVVRVGEAKEDMAYQRALFKRCQSMGVNFRALELAADVSKKELVDAIRALNEDASVHGVLIFRPLPGDLDEAARNALSPKKDVDGITDGSLASLLTGSGGFAPCTAEACIAILEHYGIPIAGKRAAVVGRSLVVGRPAALLLCQRDATVTLCHSRTKDLPSILRESELIIAAAGRANLVGADCFAPNQVIIDVGMNFVSGKMTGDADFAAAKEAVQAITPVPGGVGAVTAALLTANVVRAAQAQSS
ncbi:MAG: bifunctional 5,10-methylenetetrahydrofolate dehydrogenase/5,10-methenyltetrahydrofolate cyclohydrolase [Christensenellales bacterium]|jgi:methylenetetrahydrofolate dehydrogenase (NADP+)/methenyltetrahydrofolate cyclohydrolase